jgi:ribosome-binding protein aMBF1 (putative translation factor)
MLPPESVLSNTDLDKKMDQIQVIINKKKYKNAEYDDDIIEYLMKYLGLESYEQLQDFLKHNHIPIYN